MVRRARSSCAPNNIDSSFLKGTGSRDRIQLFWLKWIVLGLTKNLWFLTLKMVLFDELSYLPFLRRLRWQPIEELSNSWTTHRAGYLIHLRNVGLNHRKIRLKESNAKCYYLPKLTSEGTLQQVFISLRPLSLLGFCLGYLSNFVCFESGQKESVKLLQNMVSNTTFSLPPSHTPSV